jgi:hypothetical protein
LEHARTGAPLCVLPVFQRLRRCIVARLVGHDFQLLARSLSSTECDCVLVTRVRVLNVTGSAHAQNRDANAYTYGSVYRSS